MKILFKITLAIAALFTTCQLSAQKYDCGDWGADPYIVSAKSGLTMRTSPDINSEKIQAVPFGKEVMVCDYEWSNSTPIDIEGVSGFWVYSHYGNKAGYMFTGFLKEAPSVKLVVPEWQMTDYSQFSKDSSWYAIHNTANHEYLQNFEVRQCEPVEHYVSLDETAYSPDIVGDPLFIVSGIENINSESLSGHSFTGKFLFPGQEYFLNTDKGSYIIYAKGQLVKTKSASMFKAYSGIKNYKLCVKRLMKGDITERTIVKVDFVDLEQGYSVPLNAPVLRWLGDLDSDGELDMLINRHEDLCSEYMLFLSSRAERGFFSKQMARYMACDGC